MFLLGTLLKYLLIHSKLVVPDTSYTTGVLCSENDKDFIGLYYPSRIPKCKRNFKRKDKAIVANKYNVPKEEWSNYEFDHLIPLGIGGANSIHNVWPQLKNKDQELKNNLELELYIKIYKGIITQENAIEEINSFMNRTYYS